MPTPMTPRPPSATAEALKEASADRFADSWNQWAPTRRRRGTHSDKLVQNFWHQGHHRSVMYASLSTARSKRYS